MRDHKQIVNIDNINFPIYYQLKENRRMSNLFLEGLQVKSVRKYIRWQWFHIIVMPGESAQKIALEWTFGRGFGEDGTSDFTVISDGKIQ